MRCQPDFSRSNKGYSSKVAHPAEVSKAMSKLREEMEEVYPAKPDNRAGEMPIEASNRSIT
jgi:hypothetical protein